MKYALGFAVIFVNIFGWWFLDRVVLNNPPLSARQVLPFAACVSIQNGIIGWLAS